MRGGWKDRVENERVNGEREEGGVRTGREGEREEGGRGGDRRDRELKVTMSGE